MLTITTTALTPSWYQAHARIGLKVFNTFHADRTEALKTLLYEIAADNLTTLRTV